MDARQRRRRRWLAIIVLACLVGGGVGTWRLLFGIDGPLYRPRTAGGGFLVAPYVQLGDAPRTGTTESLTILWQAEDHDADWAVEARDAPGGAWRKAGNSTWRRDARLSPGPRRFYQTTIAALAPGAEFAYRVKCNGTPLFEAKARARKGAGQPHRFVAFGDGGANTYEQMAIAYRTALARPDFVLVTGDLVYSKGRLSEYLDKFFPIYNNDLLGASTGAPLLRSTPMLVAPGNHDLLERNIDTYPDALAYFLVWSLPLNGPLATVGALNTPIPQGTEPRRRAFLDLAGPAYPKMANYAFDYGDAHWTVLDTNLYTDWNDPTLRAWLEADLAAAQDAPWRFVAFHQPPFHSSISHGDEQQTRVLADLLEKYRVDIVFSGHIHNYQRSYPLRFAPNRGADGRPIEKLGRVDGRWTLDTTFDGKTRTRPDGVIYLVTGAGGARLYDSHQQGDHSSLQEFTARFVSNTHSLTVVDVDATMLTVRQITADGNEVDRFIVTR
ncbi:Calcineurin-like phosphoesterase [Singulisphaera sp. GP187]|uniref:metallophosphoesterase n=1 Tax=Singulisphaera sp. GP187 TaxID=1882752 RepID=UPI00092C2EB4|nr:metallophosphoesterase [Singulisphaera sp. GP187]SIO32214.1 Calcineurin-like phosphoesterase [Singulisphaera sp. GP187]